MLMKLDDMQLGFMPGKWMTDVVYVKKDGRGVS